MDAPPAPRHEPSVESYLPRIEGLLREVIRSAQFELDFSIHQGDAPAEGLEAPEFVVDFTGPDADLLLEKNGTLLDALEYVVLKAVRLDEELFGKITLDCEDWRRLRAEELRLTALMAAERVSETGDPFTLNPMTPRERRIVHLVLRDQPNVRTASEGKGSDRRVIIHPTNPPPHRRT